MKLTITLNESAKELSKQAQNHHDQSIQRIGKFEVDDYRTSEPSIELGYMPRKLPGGLTEDHVVNCVAKFYGTWENIPEEGIYEDGDCYGTFEIHQNGSYLRLEAPTFEGITKFYNEVRGGKLKPTVSWKPSDS